MPMLYSNTNAMHTKLFEDSKTVGSIPRGGGIHRVITYLHIQVPYTLDASALSNLSLDYWASGHHHNLMNVCDFVCYNLILDRLAHS